MTLVGERPFRIRASVEELLLAAALFWLLAGNQPFLRDALQGRSLWGGSGLQLAATLVLAVVALHVLLLGLVAQRRTVKPLIAVLTIVTALAAWFSSRYGVVLDPSMLRNVLHTNVAEARELLGWPLAVHLLLFAAAPIALLMRVEVQPRASWRHAAGARLALLAGALAVLLLAVMLSFQPLAALTRTNKALRYEITPANVLWSLGAVAAADLRGAALPRQPIGTDAMPGPAQLARHKPLVVVLVVGETARAANWGLAGYARPTTPQLAQLPVVAFDDVTSCGTNTETSVPCMFAPVGRRDYDEARIRRSESLLQVAARAGVGVRWRDNQSGCKGVCDGLPYENVRDVVPALCDGEHCLDEGLLAGLPAWLQQVQGTQLLVLHQLGNHGPSYFRRYPKAFERFTPACQQDDLRRCSQQEIVNAYDNALLYTDHVLAELVRTLGAAAGRVDSAMVYVSDHGESLGENNLYLHGLPYAIAPDVQKKVPMVMWASEGAGVDTECLKRRAAQPAAHDHLFHTLLGLLDVRTSIYEPAFDLAAGCRPEPK